MLATFGSDLAPNGVAVGPDGSVYAVTFRGRQLLRIDASGDNTLLVELPGERNDGLIVLGDGTWLVSSWETRAVLRVHPDGAIDTVVAGLTSPADLGYDARRARVIIPSYERGWLRIHPLE